jgi:hypothetical protein
MKFRICHRGDFLSVQLCGVPSIRELLLCAQSCERFQEGGGSAAPRRRSIYPAFDAHGIPPSLGES